VRYSLRSVTDDDKSGSTLSRSTRIAMVERQFGAWMARQRQMFDELESKTSRVISVDEATLVCSKLRNGRKLWLAGFNYAGQRAIVGSDAHHSGLARQGAPKPNHFDCRYFVESSCQTSLREPRLRSNRIRTRTICAGCLTSSSANRQSFVYRIEPLSNTPRSSRRSQPALNEWGHADPGSTIKVGQTAPGSIRLRVPRTSQYRNRIDSHRVSVPHCFGHGHSSGAFALACGVVRVGLHRGRGIGSALTACDEQGTRDQVDSLYLYTSKAVLYEGLGWRIVS
jgi:hypothetical protein